MFRLLLLSVPTFNRPNVFKIESTVEKIYGSINKCSGNMYFTGVTEETSFYNELQNLLTMERRKNLIPKNCLKNLPSLVSANFKKKNNYTNR
tara:strand:+ start:139 stop:414 length:276 start_codon:yes stop_codon:yes gene_type:complete